MKETYEEWFLLALCHLLTNIHYIINQMNLEI